MFIRSIHIVTVAMVLAFVTTSQGQSGAAKRSIVVLRPGVSAPQVSARHGLVPDHVYEQAINGFAGVVPPGLLRQLQGDPDVAWIEEDQVYSAVGKGKPVPPPPPQPAQAIPAGIARVGTLQNVKAAINGVDERVDVDVAIIDSGIELSHPDLYVFRNVSFVRRAKTGNDDFGHGTHVAGTVGALDNAIGVVGVAPGARLWAVKVLDHTGSGWLSDVIKGVDYVTANSTAVEVANMSVGGPASDALNAAIANSAAKGVVYVAAAGNEAADAAGTSPANSPDVLTVSAFADTDGICGGSGPATFYYPGVPDDAFAPFSNFGAAVDVAAPGVDVLSTYLGSGYAWGSGTSMAAPHVAGAVALYLAGGPKPGNANDVAYVRAAIVATGSTQNGDCGFSDDPDAVPEPVLNLASF